MLPPRDPGVDADEIVLQLRSGRTIKGVVRTIKGDLASMVSVGFYTKGRPSVGGIVQSNMQGQVEIGGLPEGKEVELYVLNDKRKFEERITVQKPEQIDFELVFDPLDEK